jgi:hypothetical protein
MPYAYSGLVFWDPATRSPRPDPGNQGGRLKGAGLALNHGLLVGERLGVPTALAEQILADVAQLPEDVPGLFLEDDLAELAATYCDIGSALREVIDEVGRATRPTGAAFTASGIFGQDEEGRVFVRAGHVLLADLLPDLVRLCEFLRSAQARGLLVMEEEPGA